MILFEQGLAYWQVAKRYHTHRTNPAIKPTAVRDMQRLQQESRSPAVLRRINAFIANHRVTPSGGDGPRYA